MKITINKAEELLLSNNKIDNIERNIIIGNLDGVHLGHQFLIEQARNISDSKGQYRLTCIIFYPHSRNLLNPNLSPRRNMFSLEDKYNSLTNAGIDEVIVIQYSEFFQLTAEEFIQNFLIKTLKCQNIIVGPNFRFGFKKLGDINLLQKYQSLGCFGVIITKMLYLHDLRISSSQIRQELLQGDIKKANQLLGYHYYIKGTVVEGKKLGRTIGFPTINVDLENIFQPKSGVYSALLDYQDQKYLGVLNIGKAPTIGNNVIKLEMFIFNFSRNLYNEQVKIILIDYIREEKKFNNIEDLKQQIRYDCYLAKNTL